MGLVLCGALGAMMQDKKLAGLHCQFSVGASLVVAEFDLNGAILKLHDRTDLAGHQVLLREP